MPKPFLCFAAVRRSITDGGFYVAGLTTDSGQLIHGRECPDGNTRRISSKAIMGRFATYDEAKARADRLERAWAAFNVHVEGARHALRHAQAVRRAAVQSVVDHDRDVRTAEKNRRAAVEAIAAGREPVALIATGVPPKLRGPTRSVFRTEDALFIERPA